MKTAVWLPFKKRRRLSRSEEIMETTVSTSTQHREGVGFTEYQQIAESTDQNRGTSDSGMSFYLLGLFGETGSLLAELKKKRRDERAYSDYRAGVLEEFGDVLWYLTNAISRTGSTLAALARETDGSATDGQESLQESEEHSITANTDISSAEFERLLISLGGQAGVVLRDFEAGVFESDPRLFQKRLGDFYGVLYRKAKAGRVDLHDAAAMNARKIRDRWPGADAKRTPLFDDRFDVEEQIPREIDMFFIEKQIDGKSYVIQKCNGIKIGDRLTDNMVEDDGYRYHDVFHLSYAAVLGWSPV